MATPNLTPDDIRMCVICGARMMQKAGEKIGDFRRRKTCSRICTYKAISNSNKPSDEPIDKHPSRVCEICAAVFYPSPGQILSKFNRRQTCSKECRYEQVRQKHFVVRGTKTCESCGMAFTSRRDNGSVESTEQWNVRRFCSSECFGKATTGHHRAPMQSKRCSECGADFSCRADERAGNYARRLTCSHECAVHRSARNKRLRMDLGVYPLAFRHNRDLVLDRDNNECRLCGSKGGLGIGVNKSLHVHHINYCKEDSTRLDNLITLCRSCHMKTNVNRAYWQSLFEAMLITNDLAETG